MYNRDHDGANVWPKPSETRKERGRSVRVVHCGNVSHVERSGDIFATFYQYHIKSTRGVA